MSLRAVLAAARLYAIFDTAYSQPQELEKILCALLNGGADIIQIRAKNLAKKEILSLALRARALLYDTGVPLIINDYPDIASDSGADGVHLGQDDGNIAQTRSSYRGILIGRSTHNLTQAHSAFLEGADYIGFGPLFPTPTKAGRPAIGLGDLHNVRRTTTVPAFAIGGIKLHNLPEVLAAGARRVVIVSGILQAADIASECRRIKEILQTKPVNAD